MGGKPSSIADLSVTDSFPDELAVVSADLDIDAYVDAVKDFDTETDVDADPDFDAESYNPDADIDADADPED